MTIYGDRYQKTLKEKLSELIKSYDSFKDAQPDKLIIPENSQNDSKILLYYKH